MCLVATQSLTVQLVALFPSVPLVLAGIISHDLVSLAPIHAHPVTQPCRIAHTAFLLPFAFAASVTHTTCKAPSASYVIMLSMAAQAAVLYRLAMYVLLAELDFSSLGLLATTAPTTILAAQPVPILSALVASIPTET